VRIAAELGIELIPPTNDAHTSQPRRWSAPTALSAMLTGKLRGGRQNAIAHYGTDTSRVRRQMGRLFATPRVRWWPAIPPTPLWCRQSGGLRTSSGVRQMPASESRGAYGLSLRESESEKGPGRNQALTGLRRIQTRSSLCIGERAGL